MPYCLDSIEANCYPKTTVLINKFGIQNANKLLQIEIEITQEAAARWEYNPMQSTFDFEHYKMIHKHLFDDLYDWAGQIRDVNISKKGTYFCPYHEIGNHAARVFNNLRKSNYLQGLTKNRFVAAFVELYVATNYLHPFREGNGRAQRLFLSQVARNAGYTLNFADIDIDELMMATILSAQGVEDGLKKIFTKTMYKTERP